MRSRRWNILISLLSLLIFAALIPVLYIEALCRAPLPGYTPRYHYPGLVEPSEKRAEAASWLTYPEWHIVYSAQSLGRHLRDAPPSSYPYWQDVQDFWSGYCLANRVTSDMGGAGDYKLMVYTIGLSFSAEMLVKALYENTLGRLFEFLGGWKSEDDAYAARTQQRYAAFMHQTPWYRFPFWTTFKGLWGTSASGAPVRHWERRFALSAEYGVKTGYAKTIDGLTGATLGRAQTILYFVGRGSPGDARVHAVRSTQDGFTVFRAPRYAAFTDVVGRMAYRPVQLIEISGNNDIFVTFLMPDPLTSPEGVVLFANPLPERPGWSRVGVSTKVDRLLPLIRAARATGGQLEHVYDY